MDRQLFSDAGRVSAGKTPTGGVPVSVALHAMAIGAVVVLSGAMRTKATAEARQPPLVFRVQPGVPPTTRATTEPPAPPRGGDRSTRSRGGPLPPAPRPPTPDVAPAIVLPTLAEEPILGDVDPIAVAENVPGGAGPDDCAECPIGSPTGVRNGPGHPDGSGAGGPIRISTMNAPERLRYVPPVYPRVAVNAGLTGVVVVDCVIAPDGRVRDARALSGSPVLRGAAIDAVRQWVYTEPRLNGQPVSVLLTVTVHFVLPR